MMHPDSSMFSIPGIIWYHLVSFAAAISPTNAPHRSFGKVFLENYPTSAAVITHSRLRNPSLFLDDLLFACSISENSGFSPQVFG